MTFPAGKNVLNVDTGLLELYNVRGTDAGSC